MEDNKENKLRSKLHKVFFYGLEMDEEILRSKDIEPRKKQIAYAKGYKLKVGKMAILLKEKNAKVYGLVYSLTCEEIDKLYKDTSLTDYVVEAVLVETEDTNEIAELYCILLDPPKDEENNDIYFESLINCIDKYTFPIPKKVETLFIFLC